MTRKKISSSTIEDNSIVCSNYIAVRKLGSGAFGDVFLGKGPSNEMVAIKIEKLNASESQLRHEYKVYRHITPCGPGFCKVNYFGKHEESYVLVMNLVGPSLEALFNKCNRKFSLQTVLQLAEQMLSRIDVLHSKKIVHRDLKPDNFAMGLNADSSVVHCLDFGLSSLYRDKDTDKHYGFAVGSKFRGTVRYASINGHMGIRQSRRDDLESLGYIFVYFLKGSLPWQGLSIPDERTKRRKVLELKQNTSVEELCTGLPSPFVTYLNYVRGLGYDEDPNMPFLRGLFTALYKSSGFKGFLPGKGRLAWDWDAFHRGDGVGGTSATPRRLDDFIVAKKQQQQQQLLVQPTPVRITSLGTAKATQVQTQKRKTKLTLSDLSKQATQRQPEPFGNGLSTKRDFYSFVGRKRRRLVDDAIDDLLIRATDLPTTTLPLRPKVARVTVDLTSLE